MNCICRRRCCHKKCDFIASFTYFKFGRNSLNSTYTYLLKKYPYLSTFSNVVATIRDQWMNNYEYRTVPFRRSACKFLFTWNRKILSHVHNIVMEIPNLLSLPLIDFLRKKIVEWSRKQAQIHGASCSCLPTEKT